MHTLTALNRIRRKAPLAGLGLSALMCGCLLYAAPPNANEPAPDKGLSWDPPGPSRAALSSGEKANPVNQKTASTMRLAAVDVSPAQRYVGAGASVQTNPTPTYLRDILPILMRRCSRCHNQEARFVYNWLDYRTAHADRWEIRRRVWDSWRGSYFKESMPIANSPEAMATTEEERLEIRNWVSSGALRGVPPPPRQAGSKEEKIQLGRQLFRSICAACHQPTGRGIPNVFPPLAGSDFLNANKDRAIKIVINGRQGVVVVNGQAFNNSMPSFPLSDDDIANVLTFVYNSFGNSGIEVNADEVKYLRTQPPDVVPQGPNVPTAPPPPPNPYE